MVCCLEFTAPLRRLLSALYTTNSLNVTQKTSISSSNAIRRLLDTHHPSLVKLMGQLNSLGLPRIQNHSRVIRLAIAGNFIASLGRDRCSSRPISTQLQLIVDVEKDLLLSFDVEDFALRLTAAPVPAYGVAFLWAF